MERWARVFVYVFPFHYVCVCVCVLRGGCGGMCACWFSSFLLFGTRCVRYLMALWCIIFMRVLMVSFEIFKLVSLLIERLCMAP